MAGCGYIGNNTLIMAAIGLFFVAIFAVYPVATAQAASSSAKTSSQESSDASLADAVMIIRFNQKNVYFQDSLKKMVEVVSSVKPDAEYYIQSVIPADKEDIGYKYKIYNQNLRLVVAGLNQLGIPIERVKVDITDSDSISDHEIRIFIK